MASKAPDDSQTLPTKEHTLFKTLVKQYESKLYKKGIKTADTILRKFPNHGETLAMKGLVLNCHGRKAESFDLVKRGVKANLRSHVCWHVYGLLYKSDREYDEAIKCYKNALRMDADNLTVLRDLAQLQVHMRDLPGYLETRQILLVGNAKRADNWVAFAAAHHLCGNHEVAAKVLDSFEGTIEDGVTAGEAYEHSEIVMYKAAILEEGGLRELALAALDSAEGRGLVRDKLGAAEGRGRLYLSLGQYSVAEGVYRRLLGINMENYRYHDGLRAAIHHADAASNSIGGGQVGAVPPEEGARLAAVYSELQREHPHSSAARRIPLDFLQGDEFLGAADTYVRRYLVRGIPSLFSDLKPLYTDPAKAALLGELFARLEATLLTTDTLPPLPERSAPSRPPALSPQALVWTRFYLAQHHDRLGNTGEALRLIDACIAHTPTLIELHTARAKILKHGGDLEGAAQAAQRARGMDLADRFLNNTAAVALFRAGQIEEGERVAGLFTRDDDHAVALYEMQASWYEVASGRAYLAAGDLGRALKRFLKVDSHFADFVEDQFDFHGYCARKQTMRAYVDMLRMVDSLYAHPVYGKAMGGAIAAYLALHDSPPGSKAEAEEAAAVAGMTPDEAKRYRQRRRKEEQRKAKEAAAAAEAEAAEAAAASEKKAGDKAAEAKKKSEPDPDGAELAATPDPLGEATKYVRRLAESAAHRLDTHLLAFEVYSRKGKPFLALKAVKAALKLAGAAHPEVHKATVRLAQLVASGAAKDGSQNGGSMDVAAGAVESRRVLEEQVAGLLGSADVAAFHESWAREHGSASLPHRAAAAELAGLLHPQGREDAARGLVEAGPSGGTYAECVAAHSLLLQSKWLADAGAAERWRQRCAEVFRHSRYFGGPDCVQLDSVKAAADGVDGVAQGISQLGIASA